MAEGSCGTEVFGDEEFAGDFADSEEVEGVEAEVEAAAEVEEGFVRVAAGELGGDLRELEGRLFLDSTAEECGDTKQIIAKTAIKSESCGRRVGFLIFMAAI